MTNKLLDIDRKAIGWRMRKEREALKLTREKFAEIVDLSALYVGQLERGERQMSLSTLVKISNSLHITTDYLIYGRSSTINNRNFVKESKEKYVNLKDEDNCENNLYFLLKKCSKKELKLIENLIKLILPYIR
ncbi:helix-turn-helix domain-containing protein [Clostridium sp. LBM24168]